MNFLGMGAVEILVIFVVAFLALGPGKTIEMARTTGKLLRDVRRTFNEVAAAVSLDDDDRRSPPGGRPPSSPPPGGSVPQEPAATREDSGPQNPQ